MATPRGGAEPASVEKESPVEMWCGKRGVQEERTASVRHGWGVFDPFVRSQATRRDATR
jgi:hypothetical protein